MKFVTAIEKTIHPAHPPGFIPAARAVREWAALLNAGLKNRASYRQQLAAVGKVASQAQIKAKGAALPAATKAGPKLPYKVMAGESITIPIVTAPTMPTIV